MHYVVHSILLQTVEITSAAITVHSLLFLINVWWSANWLSRNLFTPFLDKIISTFIKLVSCNIMVSSLTLTLLFVVLARNQISIMFFSYVLMIVENAWLLLSSFYCLYCFKSYKISLIWVSIFWFKPQNATKLHLVDFFIIFFYCILEENIMIGQKHLNIFIGFY